MNDPWSILGVLFYSYYDMQSCVLDIKQPKQYAFHQNKSVYVDAILVWNTKKHHLSFGVLCWKDLCTSSGDMILT